MIVDASVHMELFSTAVEMKRRITLLCPKFPLRLYDALKI